jgi:hypothetical protein
LQRSLVLLMMETEQPEGLSARKLIVETAKHNVLTAYSRKDGVALLQRFPNVDAVLVHGLLPRCQELIHEILTVTPGKPIIVATPSLEREFVGATYTIPSHQPQALLDLLATAFGVSLEN